MVDHKDTYGTRSISLTPREWEAEKKHVECMQSHEDSVKHTNRQKR